MNAYARLSETLTRLATVPSITRTRREDALRYELHGGVNGELTARVEATLARVEKQLAQLEKARI